MLQKFHCEHVLEELGNCGRYQKVLIICVLMPLATLIALHSSTLYNELVPDHWCRVPVLANFSYGEQHRLIRPRVKTDLDTHQSVHLSQCEMNDINYAEVISGLEVVVKDVNNESVIASTANIPIPTRRCGLNGWMYNREQYRASAAMQYSFVCEHKDGIERIKLIRRLASGLFSTVYACLADRYGRKFGLVLVLVALIASAISPIVSTNYYAFLACQALSGSTLPISILLVLALGVEFMPPQSRANVLLFTWLAFHWGEWIAYLLAETVSHWVWITATNTALVLPCLLLVIWVTDETPQWILARSRDSTRLKAIFMKLNQVNNAKLDEESLNSIVSKFTHFADYKAREQQRERLRKLKQRQTSPKMTMEQFRVDQEDSSDEIESRTFLTKAKLFLRRSTLFQMILLLAFVLLTNDLIVDLMHRERSKFNENLVLDYFFGSLIKMPAILLTWYLIEQRIGRRWSNCAILCANFLVLLVGALFTRLIRFRVTWLDVTISMMGIMLGECSSIITLLQAMELSPTRYRMTVVGLTYSFGRLASTGLIYAFNMQSLRILFNIYTRLTILLTLSLLSILICSFVAETRNEFLPLGLLASEQLITSVRFWSLSKKKSDITPSNLFLSLSKWDINSNHQIVGTIKHMEKFTDS